MAWEHLTDRELAERFEAGDLDRLGHGDHVRLGWLTLREHDLHATLDRFAGLIRQLARVLGVPDLYHETVTWAYLFLIRERMAAPGAPDSWEAFAAENPDLLEPGLAVLRRYYTDDTLASARAKAMFVMPDRL